MVPVPKCLKLLRKKILFVFLAGDNSVLMQKVAKEHLEMFKGHTLLKPDQVSNGFFYWNIIVKSQILPLNNSSFNAKSQASLDW